MKTVKFCLLLAFLSSPILVFSRFWPEKDPVLQTTVHADAALNRLRVVVSKPKKEALTLRVLKANGRPLHEQHIAGGAGTVQANLNLRALPSGTYRVEVSGQSRTQANLVQLSPSEHPALKRRIDVWAVD